MLIIFFWFYEDTFLFLDASKDIILNIYYI